MTLRLGELCAGYNGLGIAVEEVFGATPAWFSEYDAAPSKILAHHYPNVPNYGDMTAIDWANIEPVDIISGGTPCQDLSAAGARRGMTEGTRSNLWVQMREAIAIQKPAYVVWENVRGAYSAEAASNLEFCPGCMGATTDRGAVLRALGRVLGDLSDLGYDTQWRGIRAGAETNEGYGSTHVGSCHARFRVFVLAAHRNYPGRRKYGRTLAVRTEHAATEYEGPDVVGSSPGNGYVSNSIPWWAEPLADATGTRCPEGEDGGSGSSYEGAGSWGGEPERGSGERIGSTADAERLRSQRWGVNGYLASAPGTSEADGGERERHGDAAYHSNPTNWGDYEPAIRRWERVLGRSAPRPTEPSGRDNAHRLSPAFVEWMMGLPAGWVTQVPGVNRNAQLKALGNGVVPQQAIAALRDMLAAFEMEAAA